MDLTYYIDYWSVDGKERWRMILLRVGTVEQWVRGHQRSWEAAGSFISEIREID